MAAAASQFDRDQLLIDGLRDLSFMDQGEACPKKSHALGFESHDGTCAICLDAIALQETALVQGCEHAYCVTCILRWASYKENTTCPQCKAPFEFLNVHRAIDGSIHDYMFEESVRLLLRASWFEPLAVQDYGDRFDDNEDHYSYDYEYEDEDDGLDEAYFCSSSIRIGNRRWGDNGYVRAGRQEARPVYQPNVQETAASSSSSRQPKKKEVATAKEATGRRAKRALKREAADKVAAAQAAHKHQQHLTRLGRK